MHVASRKLPEIVDPKTLKDARAGLPLDRVVRDASEVFKALANPGRIRIMHVLTHAELCVGDLAHALDLSMSALSHQLGLLRRLKLVEAREEGRQTFYRVSDRFIGHLVHDGLAHVEQHGAGSTPGHHHPHGRHRSP